MFLDGHLELEQTARNRSGRFFTFNGTAGIWRKSCIADAGGWEHDTLTEDMDLSYRAQLKGWRFIFLKEVETPAELPVDMDGFKSQQHRWTKSSIQVCKKVLPAIWRSKVPLYVKLEATAHLTSNFAYLMLICLCFLIYPVTGRKPRGIIGWAIDGPLILGGVLGLLAGIDKDGNKMALANIRQRFELAYGHRATVTVEDSGNSYAVRLRFPHDERAA